MAHMYIKIAKSREHGADSASQKLALPCGTASAREYDSAGWDLAFVDANEYGSPIASVAEKSRSIFEANVISKALETATEDELQLVSDAVWQGAAGQPTPYMLANLLAQTDGIPAAVDEEKTGIASPPRYTFEKGASMPDMHLYSPQELEILFQQKIDELEEEKRKKKDPRVLEQEMLEQVKKDFEEKQKRRDQDAARKAAEDGRNSRDGD